MATPVPVPSHRPCPPRRSRPHSSAHLRGVMPDSSRIRIEGTGLRCADVVRIARRSASIELDEHAVARAERAYQLAVEIGAKRAVYGRTTGVGANRHTVVDPNSADQHGLQLPRTHAGGTAAALPGDSVR